MIKKRETPNFSRGKNLLEELRKSGQMLMSRGSCYTFFIFNQIELNLREAIEKSGEQRGTFIIEKVDLSDQKFDTYDIDLSIFSSFRNYDHQEEEQWKSAGYPLEELEHLRFTYLFGERWSKEDVEGTTYDRGNTVSRIIYLSMMFNDHLVEISKNSQLPLHTIVSIFHGLIDHSHSNFELMIEKSNHIDFSISQIIKVSKKIDSLFIEYLSIISLTIIIEFQWIVMIINLRKEIPENITEKCNKIKIFIRRNSFNICTEECLSAMNETDMIGYIKDRYHSIFTSYFTLFDMIENHMAKKAKYISRLIMNDNFSGEKKLTNNQFSTECSNLEYLNTNEGYLIEIKVSEKIFHGLISYKYKLSGDSRSIIKYFTTTLDRVAIDLRNNYKEDNRPVSEKTKNRYEAKAGNKLEDLQLREIFETNKKIIKHEKDGYLTRNKLAQHLAKCKYNGNNGQRRWGIRTVRNKLIKLEESGLLLPDHIDPKTNYKYYEASEKNILSVVTALDLTKNKP